jgi:hypothetical protein
MLVYRVFPHLASAAVGAAGHPQYLHRGQGGGRLDNPGHYLVWYLACSPSGAVGEAFADLDTWSDTMFAYPKLAGSRRALATYAIPDDLALLDLDDAKNLLDRGLRPTQVVERNRSATQVWALKIFRERNDRSSQMWNGVKWWSIHRPQWEIIGYWGTAAPTVVNVERLTTSHSALIDAARALSKPIV